jgi:hypothetical protein
MSSTILTLLKWIDFFVCLFNWVSALAKSLLHLNQRPIRLVTIAHDSFVGITVRRISISA